MDCFYLFIKTGCFSCSNITIEIYNTMFSFVHNHRLYTVHIFHININQVYSDTVSSQYICIQISYIYIIHEHERINLFEWLFLVSSVYRVSLLNVLNAHYFWKTWISDFSHSYCPRPFVKIGQPMKEQKITHSLWTNWQWMQLMTSLFMWWAYSTYIQVWRWLTVSNVY